jgi:hypothetical protein
MGGRWRKSRDMRKYVVSAIVAAAVLVLGVAGLAVAENPVVVTGGDQLLTLNGGFSPKRLSRTVPTPIALHVVAQVESAGGAPPPALSALIFETDRNGAIDVKGLPACNPRIQYQVVNPSAEVCRGAMIGAGTASFEVDFPGSEPIPLDGRLRIFNGGSSGGMITLYASVKLAVPTPSTLVSTIKIEKIHQGRYGMQAVVSIPKLAGGSGAVTSFSATIFKTFAYRGRSASLLTLRCPDGKIVARGKGVFSDGTQAEGDLIRTCSAMPEEGLEPPTRGL